MKRNDANFNLTEKESTTVYFICLVVTLALSFLLLSFPEGNTQTLVSYAITQLTYLVVPLIYLKWIKSDITHSIPLTNKINPIGLLLTIPIAVGAFLQNTIFSVLFNNLLEVIGITPSVNMPLTDTPLNIFLAIIAVVVLPAFAEEFLFRGIILTAYKKQGIMKACAISALIFALSHFNPAQIVHQFILGFLLAITVITTGNIWYAVIIHALNNVISLFIGQIIPAYNSLGTLNGTNALVLVAMFVIGAVILVLSFIFFNKKVAKDNLVINGNPFSVFSKKSCPAYYDNDGAKLSYITLGFLAFLVVMSILTPLTQLLGL